MNLYLLSGPGEGFSLWCLSCNDVVGCRTEIWFLKGFMFDFSGLFWGARILSGFLYSFYLVQLLFPVSENRKTSCFPSKSRQNCCYIILEAGLGGGRTVKCCVTELCLTVLMILVYS